MRAIKARIEKGVRCGEEAFFEDDIVEVVYRGPEDIEKIVGRIEGLMEERLTLDTSSTFIASSKSIAIGRIITVRMHRPEVIFNGTLHDEGGREHDL